tara:strand:+ start:179 stop:829 length:651 start_codon:yes stop_codon:yes gene_type:complete
MGKVQISIGTRFENILMEDFPEFYPSRQGDWGTRQDLKVLPDLFNGALGLEAKAGYRNYGTRPKLYQIENFPTLESPVAYVFGFHGLEGSLKKVTQKTKWGRERYLKEHMNILRAYFVSQTIVSKIWDAEARASKKRQEYYCVLKERFLKNIIQNNTFERKERVCKPEIYYDLQLKDYLRLMPEDNFNNFPYGVILHKRQDKEVIGFLKEQGVIKK